MKQKKKKYIVMICVCILMVFTAAGMVWLLLSRTGRSANLALQKGVIATCDSTETAQLSADKAIDGNDTELSSRWSSENNRESASHYIELEFPEEISVSFVVLKWERRNVISYALEGSKDGENWEILAAFDRAPDLKNQEIALQETVSVKYLRLSTYDVSRNAQDHSDIYQNVSLYEFEVYADKPAAYQLSQASVGYGEEGGRYLVMPKAPEGYQVTFLGADYEQVIGADGVVYPTIQDKEVTVGFRVTNSRDPKDTREIAQTLIVPAYDDTEAGAGLEVRVAEEQERQLNDCPQVIPALAEWRGGQGRFEPGGTFRVIVEKDSALKGVAELFRRKYMTIVRCIVEVTEGTLEDARPGDFYLGHIDESQGLGKEGYICDINDICVIKAETDTGVRWGTVTVLQILAQELSLPKGQIRDYPLYEVRGFGIDVARKAVSLETLYRIMETMSYYKMNDLGIHLNDNEILSTSGLTDSAEQAMTAECAFRLESDLANDGGQRLTSEEYAYTKEEFSEFIEAAKTYGVTVVPEIDTPAHSLSITSLYPEYALAERPESVDQIDLDQEDAVAFVREIWQEALAQDGGAFANARIVNIGMDEYYGDGEQYRTYAVQTAQMVRSGERKVRMWGSLSNIAGKTMPDPDGLQMNLWSAQWADPQEMYEAGYSLINMQNNHLYIIPGGGYDYLDREELYRNWEPNRFYDYNSMEIIPVYSPQMLGAAYMIWNDMCGRLDLGLCEYDLYERFEQPLPVLAAKLWGMRRSSDGDAGRREQSAVDSQGKENVDGIALAYEEFCKVADRIDVALFDIKGEANRLYDNKVGLEPSYEVDLRIWLEQDPAENTAPDGKDKSDGVPAQETDAAQGEALGQKGNSGRYMPQIIAQSDSAYGEWAFYAVEPRSGRVGFAREGRTYTWDYVLPRGRWVELKVVGETGSTSLYADGVLVGTLGSGEPFEEYASFVFPMQKIGGETGAFRGEVEMTHNRR